MRESFVTSERLLDRNAPVMKLFEKAKKLGVWNPSLIDLQQDRQDWEGLSETEQEVLLHVISLFLSGEEAVTVDLLPLIMIMSEEGRLEEEMYLTSFLWEEAKHVDFFDRFISEVVVDPGDLKRFESESYGQLFHDRLPNAMQALKTDRSAQAQVVASVTYNMVVEGVLAETGYHGFFNIMDQNGILPGTREGILKLREDESRHIAYGIFLLSRLMSADPSLWEVAEKTMNDLLPIAINILGDIFTKYDVLPFGLELEFYTDFAFGQFNKRIARLEKARMSTIEEVTELANEIIRDGGGA